MPAVTGVVRLKLAPGTVAGTVHHHQDSVAQLAINITLTLECEHSERLSHGSKIWRG